MFHTYHTYANIETKFYTHYHCISFAVQHLVPSWTAKKKFNWLALLMMLTKGLQGLNFIEWDDGEAWK